MQYQYFVSYFGKQKDGPFSVGHTVITRAKLIEGPADISQVSAHIQGVNGFISPATIISYQLMSKVAYE